tara:strand:+ start:707 stop:1699 length:993 start_codon:yes stop_codon:yes gene_type:complete
MAKEEKNNSSVQKKMKDFNTFVISNSLQNISGYTKDHLNDFKYIPEILRPVVNDFVRKGRVAYDLISSQIDRFDKSSDDYIEMQSRMENIFKSFVNVRNQIDIFKRSKWEFKNALGEMNEGTQDSNYFLNSSIFGEIGNTPQIDEDGNISFAIGTPDAKGGTSWNSFKLNDMSNVRAGSSPIITEPYGSKNFVWNMANKTKDAKDNNIPLDLDFIKRTTMNNLTEFGPNNTIGMAFTDMSGDHTNMSFAKQYEQGLKDKKYYTHPKTGESMPTDSAWMKDPANVEVLNIFLTDYITDIMKDIYGTIDEDTGKIKKSQADLAQEIISKYIK